MSRTQGLTVEQLAQLLDMTPRNVRAYQSRGLLDPPEVVAGRAYYSGGHVARLLLVRHLQGRGFSLESIGQVLDDPWTYSSLVRPPSDIEGSPWAGNDAVPIDAGIATIRELHPSLPEELAEVGLVEHREDGTWWTSPAVAALGSRLLQGGVDLETIVRAHLAAARAAVQVAGMVRRPDRELAPIALRLFTSSFEATLAARLGISDGPAPRA